MSRKQKGPLIIIGGREELAESGKRIILKEVTQCVSQHKKGLVIVTVATNLPEEIGADYVRAFMSLGIRHVEVLDIRTRDQAFDADNIQLLSDACAIYFTGGDQLRITSQIGGTPLFQRMLEIHQEGGVIAGTSAGAAAVPDTMLISGDGKESPRVASLGMAPGLGLLKGVVVDSHFAERGRLGRLLGAVAQNPSNLGIGIDENTAIVVENEQRFRVLGSGAVYIIDGQHISYSSLSEEDPQGSMSIHGTQLHVLTAGDRYDLLQRQPLPPRKWKAAQQHQEFTL
ncbi:MAG TPA: cyanophycinase [Tepidisphaeraceae bacterium]|jgi:cyanophycinase